jgi:predicted TIM-barrel fold metal-dependent hydrolase
VRRIRELGLHGIKMHPEYQQFRLDDARVQPLWEAARENGLPVLLHTGNDVCFPPPCNAPPCEVRRLAERWPGLTIIAGHFGGWRMWDEVERDLLGAPVWLDLAFVLEVLPPERATAMIRRHGVERVLFGTDSPWCDPARTLAIFHRLPLTPDEREKILWSNAAGLFHFPGS